MVGTNNLQNQFINCFSGGNRNHFFSFFGSEMILVWKMRQKQGSFIFRTTSERLKGHLTTLLGSPAYRR